MAETDRPQGSLQDLDRKAFIKSPKRLTPQESSRAVVVENTTANPVPVTDQATATTNKIYNVTCTLAGTEYSQALSANTKKVKIKARGNSKLKYSFVATESLTKYITVHAGGYEIEEGFNTPTLTIYFNASKAGEIVEISEWS